MTILIPIDFSSRSTNALQYAAAMAADYRGDIHLVHVVSSGSLNDEDYLQQRARVLPKLHILQQNVWEDFGIRTSFDIVAGIVTKEIINLAETMKPDLIVMASRGANSLSSALLGSNTATVMEISAIPVLAVPAGCIYSQPARIVFGTDNECTDIPKIIALINFANLQNSTIEVVHIVNRFGDEDEDDDRGLRNVERFRSDLRQSVNYPFIHCEEYQHTDVAEGMLCFVEEQNADLLVLSSKNRPLVDRLVRGNINNEFAYQLEVPLLCLHDEN